MTATRAIILLENLRHNYRLLRQTIGPETLLCAILKADAYGHGAVECARVLAKEGADRFGVARVSEGVALRRGGITTPIHLLEPVIPEEMEEAAEAELVVFVCSQNEADLWSAAAEKVDKCVTVHIKIDVGMGRVGCTPGEAIPLAQKILSLPRLRLEGAAIHFPRADEPDDPTTMNQCQIFDSILAKFAAAGIKIPIAHAANSCAALNFPHTRLDMVRAGIALYGYSGSENPRVRAGGVLKPVMRLVSRVTFLKKVEAGATISYGGRYVAKRPTEIATIPIGYADGYKRAWSGKSEVLIRDKRYAVAGTICMDQLMVDLGPDSGINLYDEATLFGPNPEGPDASELASLANTIAYEVLTSISAARVPKIYQE